MRVKPFSIICFNFLCFLVFSIHLHAQEFDSNTQFNKGKPVRVGAERMDVYLSKIRSKKVALVINQTSRVGKEYLLDVFLNQGINIQTIFSLEHGIRGDIEAGGTVKTGMDAKTGIPIISLYGKKKKPSTQDLQGIDWVIYDIQDVGVRFYTYISSLEYVMQACAENKVKLMILDRPNPNGYYIDGPVLEKKCQSFVGMQEIPLVYGLTVGEYASMLLGEHPEYPFKDSLLTIIPVENYSHDFLYTLPIAPSPNLNSMSAVYLYPSLGLFEGTPLSIGRGTTKSFEVIGHPGLKKKDFSFKPTSMPSAVKPPYRDTLCYGYDLSEFGFTYIKNYRHVYLFWLIELYQDMGKKPEFFNAFFDKLSGSSVLKKQIMEGKTEEQIRESWQVPLENYKKTRKKYLLYPD